MATQTTAKTTAQKSAPATKSVDKVAEPQTSSRTPRIVVDASKLSFSAAPAPARKSSGRKATWTPTQVVVDAIQSSWDAREVLREWTEKTPQGDKKMFTYIGGGKAVTVADNEAGPTETLLRKHAAYMGLGLAVKRSENGNGTTTITFAAKTAKQGKNAK